MSKIGKKIIQIPKGVDVDVSGGLVSVKGPKGELRFKLNSSVNVSVEGDKLSVSLKDGAERSLWGLTRALLSNMVKGVTEGFEKALEFEGVGYKANVKGDNLELNLGYSHPISIAIPAGLTVKIEKSVIKISGIDKELIGHFAAEIKSKRLPEPYKGSGIKYSGEVLIRKAGKKAATAGA